VNVCGVSVSGFCCASKFPVNIGGPLALSALFLYLHALHVRWFCKWWSLLRCQILISGIH
jgi:hypothetical protein